MNSNKRTSARRPEVTLGRMSPGVRNDSEKSHTFSDVRPECETRVGSDMALLDCDYPTAIDHRPPRLWQSLAPSRRAPLDLQANSQPVPRAIIILAVAPHDCPAIPPTSVTSSNCWSAQWTPASFYLRWLAWFLSLLFSRSITIVRYVSHQSNSEISRPSGDLGTPSIWRGFSAGFNQA